MHKPIQKRTLVTRAKLIETAVTLIAANGYGALRVDEVVLGAGVAKGTFFAHFSDKDALMDLLIGAKIDAHLDRIEALPLPKNAVALADYFLPLLHFMTSERYVFDLIVRHSGAAAKEQIGPIALTFDRQIAILALWFSKGPYRKDVPAEILAEGVQAFATQAMALHFCAINSDLPMEKRLKTYLNAWL